MKVEICCSSVDNKGDKKYVVIVTISESTKYVYSLELEKEDADAVATSVKANGMGYMPHWNKNHTYVVDERKTAIENAVNTIVSKFLYYDRKEDEDLPQGSIEEAITEGIVTKDGIVAMFKRELFKGLK
jgi:hypothetical protein